MPDFLGQLMRQKSSSCLKTASPRVLCPPANRSPFTLNPDAAFDSPSFPVICCWILLFILPPSVSPSMPSSPLSFFSSHPCPLDLRTTIRLSFQSPLWESLWDLPAAAVPHSCGLLSRWSPWLGHIHHDVLSAWLMRNSFLMLVEWMEHMGMFGS